MYSAVLQKLTPYKRKKEGLKMNCSNCGAPLKENTAFCAVCGKEVKNINTLPAERAVINRKSSKKGKKTAIVIISIVLAVCLISLGLCFALGIFGGRMTSKDVKICAECNGSFSGSGDVCTECEDINKNARECLMCHKKYNTAASLCDECLGGIDKKFYKDRYFCCVCEEIIEKEEITYVDSRGYVYCSDCDSDYTCNECGEKYKYTDISYDNGRKIYCWRCYEDMYVANCDGCFGDILTDDEYKKFKGKYYCMDCYRNLSLGTCKNCNEDIKVTDSYYGEKNNYCCEECYVGTCKICDIVLMGNKYKKVDGRFYCFECYGGKDYIGDCEDCGEELYKKSIYTEVGGKYFCEGCYSDAPLKCTFCGNEIPEGDSYSLDNKSCCKECYDENK